MDTLSQVHPGVMPENALRLSGIQKKMHPHPTFPLRRKGIPDSHIVISGMTGNVDTSK